MRELRVGYVYDDQAARRNLLAAPYCRYVRIRDWYRVLAHAGRLLNRCARRELLDVHDLAHQCHELRAPRALQLLHLFNQISYGAVPWVSSFETVLPRLRVLLDGRRGAAPSFERAAASPRVTRALSALAGAACRKLIALSQYSACMQQELLAAAAPAQRRWRELIARKTVILPPPQPRLVPSVAAKDGGGGPLRLLFIGPSFFRDGGLELLETLAALMRERPALAHRRPARLQLTIVGSLASDGRVTGQGAADQQRARAMVRANPHWIRHYESLDHETLVRLMRGMDIGVLGACADGCGLPALELQAAGCPVISTDVRALPEINDAARGWVIEVPKNRFGEALDGSCVQRERLSRCLRAGFARCLAQILAEPQQVRIKAEQALRALQSRHDPDHIGARLFDIYMECAAARPGASRTSPSISS